MRIKEKIFSAVMGDESELLEVRIFKISLLAAIVAVLVFMYFDYFVLFDYPTVFIELFTLGFLIWLNVKSRREQEYTKYHGLFVIILFSIVNIAWFTNQGFKISTTFSYLMVVVIAIIILTRSQRKLLYTIVLIDLVLMTIIQFTVIKHYYPPAYPDSVTLSYTMYSIFGILILLTLIGLFKRTFENERKLLKSLNIKLAEKSKEIEAQNEELVQQHEEIMTQNEYIERVNRELFDKTVQLEKANLEVHHTNSQLEKTVEERSSELLKANQELDLLLYRSSHDFRRPLTSIMGLYEVARHSIKDENGWQILKHLKQTALSMDSMLNKFLMLYFISADVYYDALGSLDEYLKKISDEMLNRFGGKVKIENNLKNVELSNKQCHLLYCMVFNLVENSFTFNDCTRVQVKTSLANQGNTIILKVEDDGIGIPTVLHTSIFDMYFRGNENSQGNGMGLYVVKKALERLDGKAIVESEPHKKTSFTITFEV